MRFEPDPYRILSFDGGGLHALSYLPIVENLEQFLANTIARSEQFDLLVGTSTGSIVALALKLGAPANDIIAMYQTHATAIFGKTWIWNRLFFSYRSQVLNHTLASFIREHAGDDVDITWRDLAERSRHPELELVVTLWDVGREKASFLSTRLDRPGQAEALWEATLADIITACCSAPYFFPPRQFNEHHVYCDGGITGLNNPATFGVSLIAAEMHQQKRPIDVISLGAGEATVDRKATEIGDRNAVSIALSTINALMDSSARLMDSFYESFGPSLGIRTYLRTNQHRDANSKLDDVSGIPGIVRKFSDRSIYYTLFRSDGAPESDRCIREQPSSDKMWREVWQHSLELPVGNAADKSPLASGLDAVHPL